MSTRNLRESDRTGSDSNDPRDGGTDTEEPGSSVGLSRSRDPREESPESSSRLEAEVLVRPRPRTTGDKDSEPTPQELRISIRILLHIGRQGRFGPQEVPPPALSQAGMAEALGVSQGAVSNTLGRLVVGGILSVERAHVRARMMRLKVYQLTPSGEELVRRLRLRYPS
jgi:DNA-binding MarR family transcriptional regulator